jgi:hypothetical protein
MESSDDDDDDGKFLANLLEEHNFAVADPGDDSKWTKNIPSIASTEVGIDNVDKYLLSTDDDGKFLANLLEEHNFAVANPGDDSEWTKNIPSIASTEVGIDNVDKYLLSTARHEVDVVANNFMIRVFGAQEGPRRRHGPASLEPATIINEFLDDQFLALICSQINKHIIGDGGGIHFQRMR